jgi:hypothetical protein
MGSDDLLALVDHHFQAANSEIYFGRNVIDALVTGIDEAVDDHEMKSKSYRRTGPALLACAPWFTDK